MTVKIKNVSIIILVWLIAGLLYSAQSYYYRTQIGQQVDGLLIILIDTPYFLFWAFFTPIPVYFLKRIPFAKSNLLQFITIHIALALVVSFVHAYLYNSYRLIVNDSAFSFSRTYINAVANLDYGLLVYFIVLLIIGIYDYYIRYQQLQTTLVQSQLDTVKMKLQPHFLFNTLNSIAVLIRENPKQAGETIKSLSDLLRHVLKNMENQFTELEKEIEFLKKYLSIEQIRFGSRLEILIDYSSNLNKIMIPSLILQPVVENAIQHGIAKHRGKGYVEIKILKENDKLKLLVHNNGRLKSTKTQENGIGLRITQDRLKSIYGSNFKLELTEKQQNGTQALIEIPIIEESVQ